MKAETKALLGAVVVIALALSVVSGVTYSWWEDSEDTEISVTTGTLSIDTKVTSSDLEGVVEGSSLPTTVSISGLAPDQNHPNSYTYTIEYGATVTTSVQALYIINATSDADWLEVDIERMNSNTNLDVGSMTKVNPSSDTVWRQWCPIRVTITADLSGITASSSGTVTLTNKIYQNVGITTPAGLQKTLSSAAASSKDTYVILNNDLDMSGYSWNPVSTAGNGDVGLITIDGNGSTIRGLSSPLFSFVGVETDSSNKTTWNATTGSPRVSGVVVKDLTIDGALSTGTGTMTMTATSGDFFGAFVSEVRDCDEVTVENCTLKNYTITDSSAKGVRVGGIIGGSNGSRTIGPSGSQAALLTEVTVAGCTVSNCSITAKNSLGGIIGHSGNGENVRNTVSDCKVENCTLTSNTTEGQSRSDIYRVGAVVGTVAQGITTIDSCTITGNTLKQTNNGSELSHPSGQTYLYGRNAGTGTLVLDVDASSLAYAAGLAATVTTKASASSGSDTVDVSVSFTEVPSGATTLTASYSTNTSSSTATLTLSLTDGTNSVSIGDKQSAKVTVVLPGHFTSIMYYNSTDTTGSQPTDAAYSYSTMDSQEYTTITFTTTHFSDFVAYSGDMFPVASVDDLKAGLNAGLNIKLVSDIDNVPTLIGGGVSIDGGISVSDDTTIDINGKTMGFSGVALRIQRISVHFTDLSVSSAEGRGAPQHAGTLDVSVQVTRTGAPNAFAALGGASMSFKNLNIINTASAWGSYLLFPDGDASSVDVECCTLKTLYTPLSTNASSGSNLKMTVDRSVLVSTGSIGAWINTSGSMTITDSDIYGVVAAVLVRAGSADISGSTLHWSQITQNSGSDDSSSSELTEWAYGSTKAWIQASGVSAAGIVIGNMDSSAYAVDASVVLKDVYGSAWAYSTDTGAISPDKQSYVGSNAHWLLIAQDGTNGRTASATVTYSSTSDSGTSLLDNAYEQAKTGSFKQITMTEGAKCTLSVSDGTATLTGATEDTTDTTGDAGSSGE